MLAVCPCHVLGSNYKVALSAFQTKQFYFMMLTYLRKSMITNNSHLRVDKTGAELLDSAPSQCEPNQLYNVNILINTYNIGTEFNHKNAVLNA